MAIIVGNKTYRNLQEQVKYLSERIGDATDVVKKIVGKVASTDNLPAATSVSIGDTYAVGSSSPYSYYVSDGTNWIGLGTFPLKGDDGADGEDGNSIWMSSDNTATSSTNAIDMSTIYNPETLAINAGNIIIANGLAFVITGFPDPPTGYCNVQYRYTFSAIQGPKGDKGDKGDTGATGATGAAAGFGTPTASATTLSEGASATATISTGGPDTEKIFNFAFGIPKGATGQTGTPAGFDTPTATATTGAAGSSATASVSASGPDTYKKFDFAFGIPKGDTGVGFDTIETEQFPYGTPVVTYDEDDGIGITATHRYSSDGTNYDFTADEYIPIFPGSGITIDANADNDGVEIAIDETSGPVHQLKEDIVYQNYFTNAEYNIKNNGYWNVSTGNWVELTGYWGTQQIPCTKGDEIVIGFKNIPSGWTPQPMHFAFWDRNKHWVGNSSNNQLTYDSETDTWSFTLTVSGDNYCYFATFAQDKYKTYFFGKRNYNMPIGYVNNNGLSSDIKNEINNNISLVGNRKTITFSSAKTITDISSLPHDVFVKIKSINEFYQNGNIETKPGLTVDYDASTQEFIINGTSTTIGNLIISQGITFPDLVGGDYAVFKLVNTSGSVTVPTDGSILFGLFNDSFSQYASPRLEINPTSSKLTALSTMPTYDSNGCKMLIQCLGVTGIVFNNYKFKILIAKGNDLRTNFSLHKPISNVSITRTATSTISSAIYTTNENGEIENIASTVPLGINAGSGYDVTVSYICNETNYSQWENKKWYAFGTSITDNHYINAEDNLVTGKYTDYLSELSGLQCVNEGIAGGSIGGESHSILTRILNTDVSDADLITLEGFVNDFASNLPLGDVTDTTESTLCGAIYRAVNKLQNSNAVVILLTDNTGRVYTLSSGNTVDYTVSKKNGINLTQRDYNNTIIKMAKYMGCRYIDAGTKSQINQWHTGYLTDHLHQSYLGGKQYAQTIWEELKNIQPLKTN